MSDSFNLPLLRIWCRRRGAWLSFCTRSQDRFFINPSGYFVELPDGRLSSITARVAFPLINCYPSVMVRDLEVQAGFGSASYFVFALRDSNVCGKPEAIRLSQLRLELEQILPAAGRLSPPERYLAIRLVEAGLVGEDHLNQMIIALTPGRTLGQEIISSGLIRWEIILGACLDTRSPNHFDPPNPHLDRRASIREWELAGEILIGMGKINRSKLEYALQLKREGQRTIGEILTAIGACSVEEIQRSLILQNAIREARGAEAGMLGDLMIKRGLLAPADLQAALKLQQVSGLSLAKVLLGINLIEESDVEQYRQQSIWHSLNGEIDDRNFGNWLLLQAKVNDEQLQYAWSLQGNGRRVLGKMLVSMGICSLQDVNKSVQAQANARQTSSDSEKLGSILVANGSIEAQHLERALLIQSGGRRALGEILLSVAGCTEHTLEIAVELQRQWRAQVEGQEDRLGEVLEKRGFLSPEALQQAVQVQLQTGKPMGRVLVEHGFVTPEEIIATLLMRDYKRQCDLHSYIKKNLSRLKTVEDPVGESTETMMASWFQNPV